MNILTDQEISRLPSSEANWLGAHFAYIVRRDEVQRLTRTGMSERHVIEIIDRAGRF